MSKTYNKGQSVPDDGTYVCVPCGYKLKMKKGECFGSCMNCLYKDHKPNEEFAEGQELWEKIEGKK